MLGKHRVKRVPIVDDVGNILAIISQSTIINLIHQNAHKIKDARFNQNVQQLKLGSSPCVSVNQSVTTINVFRTMDSHSFSGIAFVDDEGRLVGKKKNAFFFFFLLIKKIILIFFLFAGNISSRDIKAFVRCIDFKLLATPVGEFIKYLRQQQTNITNPTISSFATSTFATLIGKLSGTKVHRVFVVDDEKHFRPTSVISLQDCIAMML